ncbi:MAG: sigma-70 family RNA polymerase sigma factor [Thermomicrobiales bacterium]
MEESALVERARAGDTAAFEQLVRRYQDLAVRTAWVVTGSAGEAEDAAQEAFVKAYLALGRFRAGAPFRPWLLQIVVNEARNRRKSAGRRANLVLRAAVQRGNDSEASPEAATLAGERQQALLEAVNHLREEERLVVACRYFLGLSEAETAETLRCPRGTVKSRLSRALGRLRNELSVTLDGREQTLAGTSDLEQTADG